MQIIVLVAFLIGLTLARRDMLDAVERGLAQWSPALSAWTRNDWAVATVVGVYVLGAGALRG